MMDSVYQHYRKDEIPFIDHFSELIEQAGNEYRPVLTEFLDPRQVFIAKQLVGTHSEVTTFTDGGYSDAERSRLIVAPSYFEPKQADFELSLIAIHYPEKFAALTHSTILGTLANSGVRRDVFGDIITDGGHWQFYVSTSMVSWVLENITKIGRVGVRLEEVPLDAHVLPISEWETSETTVSSLRLDTVVAHVYNISRQRAKTLIQGEKVRLNFQVNSQPDTMLAEQDTVSVRGFGRILLTQVLGTTKKDKLRISVNVLTS